MAQAYSKMTTSGFIVLRKPETSFGLLPLISLISAGEDLKKKNVVK